MPVRHFKEDWNLYSYRFLLGKFLFYIEKRLQKIVILKYFCLYFIFLFFALSFILYIYRKLFIRQ